MAGRLESLAVGVLEFLELGVLELPWLGLIKEETLGVLQALAVVLLTEEVDDWLRVCPCDFCLRT